jgi:hypothetical protein
MDRSSVILVPPDSPYLRRRLPDPDIVVGEHPDRLALFARKETMSGRFDAAELAAVRLFAGDMRGLDEAIERGVRALPRESTRLRHSAAQLYERAGDLNRAIRSLRRAIPRGPFQNPAGSLRYLETLERRRLEAERARGGTG